MPTPPSRPHFETDGALLEATAVRDQNSPISPSATNSLARFEFESGRGNEGTKILMVEWEDDEHQQIEGAKPKNTASKWEVSWEGKTTTTALPARDGAEEKTHRLYFLLPPKSTIPPAVTLSRDNGAEIRRITPLPAIFPPELGASARQAGKKGVLHTIWAKKRLSVLKSEIELEARGNFEGVGLEMALQEKSWIEENFGISGERGTPVDTIGSPTSPKTPGGSSSRLSEKLKGLKLGTSQQDLSRSAGQTAQTTVDASAHPLSPETGDVAVSSFSLFHGTSSNSARPTPQLRTVAQAPPSHLVAQQQSAGKSRMSSLDAITTSDGNVGDLKTGVMVEEPDDELFAVRMSPRSPDMAKSPFSFTSKETVPWLKEM